MNFSEISTKREELINFRASCFNTGAERQVVPLNILRKNLTDQVFFFRKISGLAAPFIACYHTRPAGTPDSAA